ncbi:MAG: Uma2 family endonuclease [Chloroflexota bacterium]
MAAVRERFTLDRFLELEEEKPALEFEDGVVTQKVSPKGKHGSVQAELVEYLNRAARPHKVARAITELRTTFADSSYVPDISVYRWDRIPTDESGHVANEFRVPPDIAVEIVSPEQSVNALVRRCLWYIDHGVNVALLIDPKDESVLAFRPGGTPAVCHGKDRIDLSELLPDFGLTVEELFASLRMR